MKTTETWIVMCLVCGIFMNGCSGTKKSTHPNAFDEDKMNQKIVDTYSDLAIQNAIIAQHTLYPYHFVNNSEKLNNLGERDLTVLSRHFLESPGQLFLQRGAVDNALYEARKQMVHDKLVQAGIPQDKINIKDGLVGGDGMPSDSVIEVLEKSKEKPSTEQTQGYTGMQIQR